MSHKPNYCPVCYQDIKACKVIDDKIVVCPKCKTIINCDKFSVNVRCSVCMRLFADTLSFIDHKENYVCNYPIRQEVKING
jgi:hypothetical protein